MNTNHSNIVKKWVEKNPTPKQDHCPRVIQSYPYSVKGEQYAVIYDTLNNEYVKTGYIYASLHNVARKWYADHDLEWKYRGNEVTFATPQVSYYGNYTDYDEKNEMLEISTVAIDGHRPKVDKDGNVEHRQWRFLARRFFFKGEIETYDALGAPSITQPGNKFNHATAAYIHQLSFANAGYNNFQQQAKDLPAFTDNVVLSGNRWREPSKVEHLWQFEQFYKSYTIKRVKTDKLGLNDINIQLNPVNEDELKSFADGKPNDFSLIVFEKVNDNLAVLRKFSAYRYYYSPSNQTEQSLKERTRVFITLKGQVRVFNGSAEHWYPRSTKCNNSYSQEYLINRQELYTFLPLKYITQLIPNDGEKNILNFIINTLRHPIIESFAKAGYPAIAKRLTYYNEVASNLKDIFNTEKEVNNIYKVSGLNKYQLKKVETLLGDTNRYHYPPVKQFKRLVDNPMSLDEKTSEFLLDAIDHADIQGCNHLECFLYSINDAGILEYANRYYWRTNGDDELTEFQKQSLIKIFRTIEKSKVYSLYRTFSDAVRLYCSISDDNRPDIKLYELNADEIVRVHDILVELSNDERAKQDLIKQKTQQDRLDKINKKRQAKFEFLNSVEDYDYIIVTPKKPVEVVNEGTILHHCVGGYVEEVCNGSTNILFLRKKSEPTKPFYTIEVNTQNRLIQVHGCCNKWLGNDPEAIPFMVDWLTQAEIQFDKNILLCCATGYGSSGAKYLDGKQFGL